MRPGHFIHDVGITCALCGAGHALGHVVEILLGQQPPAWRKITA